MLRQIVPRPLICDSSNRDLPLYGEVEVPSDAGGPHSPPLFPQTFPPGRIHSRPAVSDGLVGLVVCTRRRRTSERIHIRANDDRNIQLLDRDALHATFDTWTAAEESLDAQLSESLEALAAYQSHLDDWQRQLADERTALIQVREQFERDQAAAAASQANSTAEAGAELTAARQKVADLTSSLLARTEELRTLDNRRAELVTELELVRAREKELNDSLDEQKRLHRTGACRSWTEDLRDCARCWKAAVKTSKPSAAATARPRPAVQRPRQNRPSVCRVQPHRPIATAQYGGAVLGSIVEQFGKLRQQRAVDRQGVEEDEVTNMSRRWFQVDDPASRWSIAAVAAVVFLCGVLWRNATLLGGGAVVLCLVLRRVSNPEEERAAIALAIRRCVPRRRPIRRKRTRTPRGASIRVRRAVSRTAPTSPDRRKAPNALVDDLMAIGSIRDSSCGRQAKQHLTQLDVVRAVRQLDEAMALVPAGRVLLGSAGRAIEFRLRRGRRRSQAAQPATGQRRRPCISTAMR